MPVSHFHFKTKKNNQPNIIRETDRQYWFVNKYQKAKYISECINICDTLT